jgi:hypothetical protein
VSYSAGRRADVVIQRVWCVTKCSLSERCNGGQSMALPSGGDVGLLMRQICVMFDGETANMTRSCTFDDLT